MKPAVAGSARFTNEIVEAAYERLVPIMDAMLEVLLGDGHPPLTEPVTVRNLLALSDEEAAQQIRMMLEATTRWVPVPPDQVSAMLAFGVPLRQGVDPAGNAIVERSETEAATLRLVTQYMKARQRRGGSDVEPATGPVDAGDAGRARGAANYRAPA